MIPTYSRFKGVTFYIHEKLWAASVTHNHCTYYLGKFDNEISAAQAYDSMLRRLKGDSAFTNAKLGLYSRTGNVRVRARPRIWE